ESTVFDGQNPIPTSMMWEGLTSTSDTQGSFPWTRRTEVPLPAPLHLAQIANTRIDLVFPEPSLLAPARQPLSGLVPGSPLSVGKVSATSTSVDLPVASTPPPVTWSDPGHETDAET